MRSEKEVYDIVLNFAKTDKRIRMVTLEGSRTNTNIPPDDFQDFDITFFVTDMDSFTSDDKWLDIFGERLILQKPEDMELFPAVEKGFSYLMLFTDDVKIDLTLLPLELIDEYFTWDKLVKLLLDKDNRIVKPPIPTDIDYHLQKPTQRMFDDCCNEFWNTTTYVVKGLCRKEILFAIDHMNDIVRKELLRMISWLIGIKQGFHFSLGKNYKFMKQYVPEELWERLMSTYNMDSYPHMWESFEPGRASRIDPIGISGGRTGRDKAVGRKQDNSIECLEIGCLFPPGATVVSYKMLILLESRVIMCGKHLAMCIDIYACIQEN